ncbi:MAG: methyltransferase domain-containing protein [Myxococcales bacterium]|nr:methyltransferase domain-containing protein [Myxococcales bacterium]
MSSVTDYSRLHSYYAEFESNSDSARQVAWRCHDDQHLRLEVLLEALEANRHPLAILDVGCGNGALYGLLKGTGRLGQYCGIDLMPSLLESARAEHPGGEFLEADLLTWSDTRYFDLVVCSGALNIRVPKHPIWLKKMLSEMWSRATRAVAFNLQTTRALKLDPGAKNDPDFYYAERQNIVAWCEELTPWIAVRQDYLPADAAFYLYRDYHRTAERMRELHAGLRGTAEHLCGVAYLLLERQLPELALHTLAAAAETAEVLHYRGLAHHHLKRFEEAVENYRAALELNPNLEAAKLNLEWIARNTRSPAGPSSSGETR